MEFVITQQKILWHKHFINRSGLKYIPKLAINPTRSLPYRKYFVLGHKHLTYSNKGVKNAMAPMVVFEVVELKL
jgi:hypothetical protein